MKGSMSVSRIHGIVNIFLAMAFLNGFQKEPYIGLKAAWLTFWITVGSFPVQVMFSKRG